jgi:hypothetical protein
MSKVHSVGDVHGIDSIRRGRILVGGELVYSTTSTAHTTPADFVEQPPREILVDILNRVGKKQPKVRLFAHRSVLKNPKLRVGFLIDAYLAWGRKKGKGTKEKSKVALVGGIELADHFHLDVLVFEHGKLVSLYDKELPLQSSPDFVTAAQSVVAGINEKHSDARVVLASPLGPLNVANTEFVGDEPLKFVRYRPLRGAATGMRELVSPIAILLSGILFFSVAFGIGWGKRSAAVKEFDMASNDAEIIAHGGMDSGYVGVNTQRRLFMESMHQRSELPHALIKIVSGIGQIGDVKIVELRVPGSTGASGAGVAGPVPGQTARATSAGAAPGVWMQISVVRGSGSALEQGGELVNVLAKNTSMSWRLPPQGWKDDGTRRVYTVEGFLNG